MRSINTISRSFLFLSILLLGVGIWSCSDTGMDVTSGSHQATELRSIRKTFSIQTGSNFADSLSPMYPNPFNRSLGDSAINLVFSLEDTSFVKLIIQNPLGDSVVLFLDSNLSGGIYTFPWDPVTLSNQRLREGLYFATLRISAARYSSDFIDSRLFLIEAN